MQTSEREFGSLAEFDSPYEPAAHLSPGSDPAAWRVDPALVAAAERLIEQVNTSGILTQGPAWQNSMAGARPDVPGFIAGHPACMYAKLPAESSRMPVRVFSDITYSSKLSATRPVELRMRAAMLAALAFRLGESRPVELYAIAGYYRTGQKANRRASFAVVRVPIQPLDLEVITTSFDPDGPVCFNTYHALRHIFPNTVGSWEWDLNPDYVSAQDWERYKSNVRRLLDIGENDIYLPAAHAGEPGVKLMLEKPVQWIEETVAEFNARRA